MQSEHREEAEQSTSNIETVFKESDTDYFEDAEDRFNEENEDNSEGFFFFSDFYLIQNNGKM